MGALTIGLPESLMNKLDSIAKYSELPRKMVQSGMDVAEPVLKRNLQAAIKDKDESNGALVQSVKQSKVKMNSKGEYRGDIYFDGYDDRGVPNDRKAMSMEWGTSNQVAEPFIRPTRESTKDEVQAAMQAVFDAEVQK